MDKQNIKKNEECCSISKKGKEAEKESYSTSKKGKEAEKECCSTSKKGKEAEKESCSVDKKSADTGAECGCGDAHMNKGIKTWVFLGVAFASLIASFVINTFYHPAGFLKYVDIAWIAVILCGVPIFVSAFKNVLNRKITSNVLIAIAILACVVLEVLTLAKVLPSDGHGHGNIFAAGEVAWLMALGQKIEEITIKKARSGIERLVALSPTTAKYKVGNSIIEKPISEVKIGDIVVVLPNDIISVDGIIISGSTAVDESIMTGESTPADKVVGSAVYGGTKNITGALEIEVTKTSDDMAVNKLKKLVEEAEGKKAPISKTADKWASYIVPAAIIIAIGIFFLTYFVMVKGDLPVAILRGVTMLVVFCPCALALATPTAIAAGLGAGAKRGVLIKSGEALEIMAKTNVVAFDKTGTLTKGKIKVDNVKAYLVDEKHVLQMAGAAESFSEHPIAKAVVAYAALKTEIPKSKETKSLVGIGVESVVDNKKITVCKWENLEKLNVDYSFAKVDADAFFTRGKTVSAVVEDDKLIGLIALSDEIRDGSKETIQELEAYGIQSIMLTGDNEKVAQAVASQVGIDSYYASLMPEDKLDKIEELKQSGKYVCMIGDGVNDAPALAAANCSIAMGALGSDIAIETADVALMNSDIKNVAKTVRFSKKVLTTIKFNIIMSMSINIASVFLNLFGFLNPITGALIHNVSSVLVVVNSALLLMRFGDRRKERKTLRALNAA